MQTPVVESTAGVNDAHLTPQIQSVHGAIQEHYRRIYVYGSN